MGESFSTEHRIRGKLTSGGLALCFVFFACSGDAPEQTEADRVATDLVLPTTPLPATTDSILPAADAEMPKIPAPAAQKFVEVYDPESKTFVKSVQLEGGDTLSVGEWSRVWDPKDPAFTGQIGNRYSRFAGDGEFTPSGVTAPDTRGKRNGGVTKVTHCSPTSGRLQRRG